MRNRAFHLCPFVLVVSALAGCSAPLEEDEVSSEAAMTADARDELRALEGVWETDERTLELSPIPDRVRILVRDDSVDPTTGATQGTFLRIMRDDHPTVPAVDRAPFVNVDEGRSCENVDLGSGSSVTVCHTTTFAGGVLTHTVSMTQWTGYVLPTGWSKATQTLALEGGRLRYTYTIDGELSHDVTFARP